MLSSILVVTFPLLLQLPALDADSVTSVRTPSPVSSAQTVAKSTQAKAPMRFVLAPEGNEARFRVREQLAGFDLPNDAVGKTAKIDGAMVLAADGKILKDSSRFTVDLTTLTSDQSRRDGFIKRNTIQTDSFPNAVFVPTSAQGLPAILPATGDLAFSLTGDLTIHGVTKPATWQVKAKRIAGGAVTGTATTEFKFGDFNMTIPKVARVLSVDDRIVLEYDFNLVPQAASK
jgi:polyisoprenoid-binding protein YceI